jgi:hypothetical protein
VKEQDAAKKVEERKRKLKEEAEKEEAEREGWRQMRWKHMMWQDKQRTKALTEKREREARAKKEHEAYWAAHLAREDARIKKEKKELFERVAAEAHAIRKEKEEEEKKRKATAMAKAKGPCLSE